MSHRAEKGHEDATNATGRNDGPRQARIAFHPSFWPLLVFLSFFAVGFLLLIAIMLGPGSFKEAAGTVLVYLVFQVIKNPLTAFLLLPSVFGIVLGIAIKAWRLDEQTNRIAARAAFLGFLGIAVYALLVWFWSGFGR